MAFPFSVPQAYNIPYRLVIGVISPLLLLIVSLNYKKIKANKNIVFIFFFQIITSAIWLVIHFDTGYLNFLFQIFVSLIVYFSICLTGIKYFIKQFLTFVVVSGILAAVCFVLCILFKLPYYSEFINPDGRTGYNFIITLTNVVYDFGGTRLIRPSGFFDEPGSLAFYLIIGLLINDLTHKNRSIRVCIILCGIFTLSIAFYLIIFVYSLLYFKPRSLPSALLAIFLLTTVSLFGYSNLDNEKQDLIKSFTVDRVQTIFKGKKSSEYDQADNRSVLIQNSIEGIKDSPFIGQGISYASRPDSKLFGKFMGANLLGVLGIHGIIGGLIFSLHVFYYFLVCFRKKPFLSVPQKCFLIYLVLILQRPDYIGGVLTYISVILLTRCSLNYKNGFLYEK